MMKAKFWHFLSVSTTVVLFYLGSSSVAAKSMELTYQAFLAGTKAGTAQVALEQDPHRYSVAGRARSGGLLEALNPWRAQFQATGTWVDGAPQLNHYHYTESDKRKRREVTVSQGQLRVVKNGKLRAEIDALPGMDILSALFVEPRCHQALQLHTGRHGYQLRNQDSQQRAGGPQNGDHQLCAYTVKDDDGEEYKVAVTFAELSGYRVPIRINISGVLSGALTLVDHQLIVPGAVENEAP